MRLIDADALLQEFANRAKAARRWKEKALNNSNEELAIRATATLDFLTEVKLTIEAAPTAVDLPELKEAYQDGFKDGQNDRPQGEWIPIKTRPMTEEEIEQFKKEFPFFSEEDFWAYDCPLPQDNEEVLITTGFSHNVVVTTFCVDEGCWFENYEDKGDVIAWLPLPQPYKGGST